MLTFKMAEPTPPIPTPVSAARQCDSGPVNGDILRDISRLAHNFASISDPSPIFNDLHRLVLAFEAFCSEKISLHTQEATMLHQLLITRHEQDAAEVKFLKAQLEYERMKSAVRDRQMRMWHPGPVNVNILSPPLQAEMEPDPFNFALATPPEDTLLRDLLGQDHTGNDPCVEVLDSIAEEAALPPRRREDGLQKG